MKKTTKIIGLGVAVITAGAIGWAALAQTPPGRPGFGPGFGPGFMHGGPMGFGPGAGFDPASHLAAIKSELNITPAQEQAWNAYAKTLQDTASAMQAQRQKSFDTVKAAADKMVAALDDNQKGRATYVLPGYASQGRGWHGGPMMMMHGGGWR